MSQKRLRDVLPREALGSEYEWAEEKLDTLVVARHDEGWN